MSGGKFDYIQYQISDVAEQIAFNMDSLLQFEEPYKADIKKRFIRTAFTLKLASEMLQRVDWLCSGDDGEGSFLRRWEEEVQKPFLDKLIRRLDNIGEDDLKVVIENGD